MGGQTRLQPNLPALTDTSPILSGHFIWSQRCPLTSGDCTLNGQDRVVKSINAAAVYFSESSVKTGVQ